jgi:hypothetical protein
MLKTLVVEAIAATSRWLFWQSGRCRAVQLRRLDGIMVHPGTHVAAFALVIGADAGGALAGSAGLATGLTAI